MTTDMEETPDGADLIVPSWLGFTTREEKEKFPKNWRRSLALTAKRQDRFRRKSSMSL